MERARRSSTSFLFSFSPALSLSRSHTPQSHLALTPLFTYTLPTLFEIPIPATLRPEGVEL